MNSVSEDELFYILPELRQAANNTVHNLLPEKSQNKYKIVYKNFMDWCSDKNVKSFTENVLLAYFTEISNKYKASSLWTIYSMLRSTLNMNNGINIDVYLKLRVFLKRKSDKHIAKRAKTFTAEQLNNFINEAPDDKYLATKVALIMGVMGACSAAELHSMQITDLEDDGSIFKAVVPNSKTKIPRKFTITGNFYTIVKTYLNLRPKNISKTILFFRFHNGRYYTQRLGINKFGAMGKEIAMFLKLPDSNLYTGHCFRRSSATLLADAGGDITTLKKLHSGCRSTTVAEGYVDDPQKNKTNTANKIYRFIIPKPVNVIPSAIYMQQTINLHNSVPNSSQPSTSSSGSPSTDPFKEEASCSREDASALEWLPEQTNPPDLRPKPFKGNKDKIYCRLCLKPANKNSLTPLSVVDFNYPGKSDSFKNKKLEKVEEINKMLKHCLPFYDSLTFNPIICSICFGRLKIAYEFSQECLKSQRLIEKYAETYGTTEKVINLNEMVETQFELLNHENLSETETKATDIPKVTRSSTRISRKRQYPNEDGPSTKKQKEYPESHDEDSLASSNEDASNIKIEPDDDDSCALTESVKTEPDEDDSNAFTENITHGVSLINPNKIDVDHSVIKVEPTYIDCPDFVKNESVDDLHIENKVFSERTVVKTDIEGEQSQFLGEGNVSPGVTGAPSFDRGSVFPSIGSSLEDTTSDVIK